MAPPRALLLAAADLVQFRWEATAPTASSRFVDPQTSAPVALSDTVVLDLAGIDSVWAWRRARDTSDSWDVVVRLSREGASAFGATTATHTGRRLAVLVDGRVTLMPWVEGAVGPRAMIASGVHRPVADSLAARLDTMIAALRPFLPVRLH